MFTSKYIVLHITSTFLAILLIKQIKFFSNLPGVLRFYGWSKDFKPQQQAQTHAQLWVRLMHLPQEYWRQKTLYEIASGIGTPLTINDATQSRLFGLYARILVDVDMSGKLFDYVLVEREEHGFPVAVQYEKQLAYCANCKMLGHTLQHCKKLSSSNMNEGTKKPNRKVQNLHNKHVTVPIDNLCDKQLKPVVVLNHSEGNPGEPVFNTQLEKSDEVVTADLHIPNNVPNLQAIDSQLNVMEHGKLQVEHEVFDSEQISEFVPVYTLLANLPNKEHRDSGVTLKNAFDILDESEDLSDGEALDGDVITRIVSSGTSVIDTFGNKTSVKPVRVISVLDSTLKEPTTKEERAFEFKSPNTDALFVVLGFREAFISTLGE